MFSFTASGLWRLFEESYGQYDVRVIDPAIDAERRGILKGGLALPYLEFHSSEPGRARRVAHRARQKVG